MPGRSLGDPLLGLSGSGVAMSDFGLCHLGWLPWQFSETLRFGMSSRDTKGGSDDNHLLLQRLRGPIESCQVQDWTSLINVVLAIEILELSETNVLGVCKDALDAPREDNTVNLTKS